MQEEFLAAGQIENSNPKDAIKIVVHFVDSGFELLPEDVLLGGNLRRDHGGAKSNKADVLQKGDPPASIIATLEHCHAERES